MIERFRSSQGGFRRLRAASYFARGGKVTKTPPGTAQNERSALILSRPPVAFCLLCRHGQSRSPPAGGEISPCGERNRSIIAPSSAPVCALGHLPPKGKALGVSA